MFKKLIVFALAATFIAPAFSFAQSMTWKIRSYHKNQVQVEFYSNNRNYVWPGRNQVYSIRDYDVHTYNLNCVKGEKVCYGAWLTGDASTYWGAGKGGKQGCNDCCYICNGGTTPIRNLNERR
ncbi:MAG TPA: hypothetical protein VK642_06070 [Burkholderiales bacterium]|nr:hypothetical protein [Burkholderiales bacterium]